jgi:hypothetical protein
MKGEVGHASASSPNTAYTPMNLNSIYI